MELMQLRYFAVVAKLQNMTKAAESLYMTQPALSRSISRLEKEVGLKLFSRSGNRIVLTTAGERYFQAVQEAFEILDSGLVDAHLLQKQRGRRIKVLSAIGFMKSLAAEYMKLHPLTEIQVELANSKTIAHQLLEGTADLGISLLPLQEGRLQNEILMQLGYHLVASPRQELYCCKSVTALDLEGQTLFCSRFGDTKMILEHFFAEKNVNVHLIELDEQDLLFQASMKDLGYTICMPILSLFRGSPAEGKVRFIPIEGSENVGRVFSLASSQKGLAQHGADFIQYARDCFLENEQAVRNLIQ